MEQTIYAGIPIALGFAGWITYSVFQRPTRTEVNRTEDKILSEMKEMERRLITAIEKEHNALS